MLAEDSSKSDSQVPAHRRVFVVRPVRSTPAELPLTYISCRSIALTAFLFAPTLFIPHNLAAAGSLPSVDLICHLSVFLHDEVALVCSFLMPCSV